MQLISLFFALFLRLLRVSRNPSPELGRHGNRHGRGTCLGLSGGLGGRGGGRGGGGHLFGERLYGRFVGLTRGLLLRFSHFYDFRRDRRLHDEHAVVGSERVSGLVSAHAHRDVSLVRVDNHILVFVVSRGPGVGQRGGSAPVLFRVRTCNKAKIENEFQIDS